MVEYNPAYKKLKKSHQLASFHLYEIKKKTSTSLSLWAEIMKILFAQDQPNNRADLSSSRIDEFLNQIYNNEEAREEEFKTLKQNISEVSKEYCYIYTDI